MEDGRNIILTQLHTYIYTTLLFLKIIVHRQVLLHFLGIRICSLNLTGKNSTDSSSAFAANGHEILPGRAGLPVLPQSGNICAVLGLVVAFCEQLGKPERVNKNVYI